MDKRNRRIVIWLPVLLVVAITAGMFLGIKLQNRKQAVNRTMFVNAANKVSMIMNLIERNTRFLWAVCLVEEEVGLVLPKATTSG